MMGFTPPWSLVLAFFLIPCQSVLQDALGPDSVVLITGVAGFLGSELALTLDRVYHVKLVIGIDSMQNGFHQEKSEEDLALFEIKRQRVFRWLQNCGAGQCRFFRVDFRPSVPEYFDTGEVPVLKHIFEDHPDITHVVHFADHYHRDEAPDPFQQVIPRIRGQVKAGMIESLLEQISEFTKANGGRQPHFLYASSADVYNRRVNQTLVVETKRDDLALDLFSPPFLEENPITTPSSTAGTAKLLDEILAQTYYEMEGIYSLGLRFFTVYGPWGLQGSPMFEVADRIVNGQDPLAGNLPADHVKDYVFIDDAIDAAMSAMQFRPITNTDKEPRPVVINVGSGQGTTIRAVVKTVAEQFPGAVSGDFIAREPPTVSFASMARAYQLLNFRPIVPLHKGMEILLGWHYDRAYPYGAKPTTGNLGAKGSIGDKGAMSCDPYDVECLRGTPVFPCASECANEHQCLPTFWDDVIEYTKTLSSGCHAVLYTIALEDELRRLPSTVVKVSEKAKPFVLTADGTENNCNIAFVSEDSVLYQKLGRSTSPGKAVQHGLWRLVAVKISPHVREEQLHTLALLPKVSPGQFFSVTTRQTIYCDPDITLRSVPKLLKETGMQPHSIDHIQGSTALLIGKRKAEDAMFSRWDEARHEDQMQDDAYRTIRIALIEDMKGDGFGQMVDSSFLVHAVASEDSRLFRCDVFGEVTQWNASSDQASFEFIIGLHDLWSRVISRKSGRDPWWIGEDVKTVDQEGNLVGKTHERHFDEGDEVNYHRRLAEIGDDETADDVILGDANHNGFGAKHEDAEDEPLQKQARYDSPVDDQFDFGDDWQKKFDGIKLPVLPKAPKDPSSYDVWMGIISSSSVWSFSRIVDMDAVGATRIKDYQKLAFEDEL